MPAIFPNHARSPSPPAVEKVVHDEDSNASEEITAMTERIQSDLSSSKHEVQPVPVECEEFQRQSMELRAMIEGFGIDYGINENKNKKNDRNTSSKFKVDNDDSNRSSWDQDDVPPSSSLAAGGVILEAQSAIMEALKDELPAVVEALKDDDVESRTEAESRTDEENNNIEDEEDEYNSDDDYVFDPPILEICVPDDADDGDDAYSMPRRRQSLPLSALMSRILRPQLEQALSVSCHETMSPARRKSFGVPEVPNTTIVALKGLEDYIDEDEDDEEEYDRKHQRGRRQMIGKRKEDQDDGECEEEIDYGYGEGAPSGTRSTKSHRRSIESNQSMSSTTLRRKSSNSFLSFRRKSVNSTHSGSGRRSGGNGGLMMRRAKSKNSLVSFDEQVKLEHVDSFKKVLKKKERRHTWYTEREMDQIQNDMLDDKISGASSSDDQERCEQQRQQQETPRKSHKHKKKKQSKKKKNAYYEKFGAML